MAGRYSAVSAPRSPRREAPGGDLDDDEEVVIEKLDGCLIHEALAALWETWGAANATVDAKAPWVLTKSATAGDEAATARPAMSSATWRPAA